MGGSRFELGVTDEAKVNIIDRYFANNYAWLGEYVPLGHILIQECRRTGLWVSTGCALVEKESGARNVFGCDWGDEFTVTPPYCRVPVTRPRVEDLITHVHNGGGQNGVGVTQLTTLAYVLAAQDMGKHGGAHLPRYQMRVGFTLLNNLLEEYDYLNAIEAYNDGNGRTNDPANPYDVDFAKLHRAWKNRLSRVSTPDRPTTSVMAVVGSQERR